MPSIEIEVTDRKGEKHAIQSSSGDTLMSSLRSAGLPVIATCSGAMSCATCHVYVKGGYESVGLPSEDEIDLLLESEHYREGTSRLSCQIEVSPSLSGLCIELAAQD